MKRILILSDSLALPRTKPELCSYEDTYPVLLKERFEVHQVSIGAATSEILLKQVHYHLSFNPDIVIIQVGIVDCAPRFMTRKEIDASYAFGSLGKLLRWSLNKKWVRNLRKVTYTSKTNFKIHLKSIRSKINSPILAIEIAPAPDVYEKILPGIRKNILDYNNILRETFDLTINTNEILNYGLMSDHHHINKKGHLLILSELKKAIDKI